MNNSDERTQAVARVHYEAFEWSGCAGSSWHRMTTETRQKALREASDWIASVESAGFSVVSTEALGKVLGAIRQLGLNEAALTRNLA